MCGTMNDQSAKSCSFCGYLFEDYGTPGVSANDSKMAAQSSVTPLNMVSPPSSQEPVTPAYPSTATSSGSPLFVVSRSILASVGPGLAYLLFIVVISLFSSISIFSLALIAFLLLASVVPVLFTPRKFEFFDDSLRIHKIIGGDSEFQYSDLTMSDSPVRRRPQIILSAVGQRRPIVIQGNPTNKELGIDLKQFLNSKLKKPETPQNAKSPADETSTDTAA
jgi:hypothetical protein